MGRRLRYRSASPDLSVGVQVLDQGARGPKGGPGPEVGQAHDGQSLQVTIEQAFRQSCNFRFTAIMAYYLSIVCTEIFLGECLLLNKVSICPNYIVSLLCCLIIHFQDNLTESRYIPNKQTNNRVLLLYLLL